MKFSLRTLKCPFCKASIPSSKEWITICNHCGKHLEVIWYGERVVSIRRAIYPPDHYLNGTRSELLQALADCVERDLSPAQWGFREKIRLPDIFTVIYDSEFCRVKFALRGSDYGPVYASGIYYGRLHAPDNEFYIASNGEECACWHSDSTICRLMLPFMEGLSPQQTVTDFLEFWQSMEKALNVEHPSSDYIEYPLKLHAKIWERYGRKLFALLDLRQPELWKEYYSFRDEYYNVFYSNRSISHPLEKIC